MPDTQTLRAPYSDMPVYFPGGEKSWGRRPLHRTRWFISSAVKTGKTTLASSCPYGFMCDYESKADLVPKDYVEAGWTYIPDLKHHDSMHEWLKKTPPEKSPIKMVWYDTMDEFLYGCLIPGYTEEVNVLAKANKRPPIQDIREYGSSSKGSRGWDMVYTRLANYLRELWRAGYGWAALGHVKEKEVQIIGPDGQQLTNTRRQPALPAGAQQIIYRAAEFIGVLNTRITTETTDVVLLDGTWRPAADPEVQKEVKRKEQGGDRVITRKEEKKRSATVLSVTEKRPDSEEIIGSNVSLPAEIELPLGGGWAAIEKAYNSGSGDTK